MSVTTAVLKRIHAPSPIFSSFSYFAMRFFALMVANQEEPPLRGHRPRRGRMTRMRRTTNRSAAGSVALQTSNKYPEKKGDRAEGPIARTEERPE